MKKRAKKTKGSPKGKKAGRKHTRPNAKRARLRADEDRAKRLRQVAKLRFVQCWSNDDIAKTLDLSCRQIERDVRLLRTKFRKDAQKELSYEMRDIAEAMKLRHEETIKLLWNDHIRVAKEAEELAKEISLLRGEMVDVGEETEAALLNATQKETLLAQALGRANKILWQITETDGAFVDQMRKLGLVKNEIDIEDDGSEFIIAVRARRREVEQERKKLHGATPPGQGGK